jgi:hypothetical protein
MPERKFNSIAINGEGASEAVGTMDGLVIRLGCCVGILKHAGEKHFADWGVEQTAD